MIIYMYGILFFQRCEQRIRSRKPVGGLGGTAMGDLEGAGVSNSNTNMGSQNVGRRPRRGTLGHQPPFPKAVSIIDTLSELAAGPEVTRLAQEQRPRPVRPRSGSRPSKGHSNNSSVKSDETSKPPGPPVVSPDFQQYTEKIYDAVTSRRPDPAPSLKSTHHQRGRSAPGNIHSGRKCERNQHAQHGDLQNEANPSSGDNGDHQGLRHQTREHHHLHQQLRGRERGRTPDWIKRIFDIAKKGDLPSLVSILFLKFMFHYC